MLHKCANPACPNLFRSLRRGKLFLLHMDSGAAGVSRIESANPSAHQKRAIRWPDGALLVMRWLLLVTHPGLRTRTGNGYGSASGEQYCSACPASEADAAGGESVSRGTGRCLMNRLVRTPQCAICRQERSANQPRFLIAENTWEDKLTIMQWNDHLAARPGIQLACSIEHVEELVLHWMITGRLDYPFARSALAWPAGGKFHPRAGWTSKGRVPSAS